MRILILSANTGGGHNSTAKALGEQMEQLEISYEIADTLSFISEKVSDFISWGHSYVYRRLPRLFGMGYRYEEKHSVSFIYNQCAKGADALYEKLQSDPFDAVICTHVFSGLMMTELRKRYGAVTPCYFVATDYTCSPGVSQMNVDGYFIPHRMLLGEFVHNGLAADKLFPTGIPIGDVFYESHEKAGIRGRLALPQDKKVILFSCGSMGCGKLEKSAKMFLRKMPQNACLVVLCGHNERAYEILRQYANDCFIVLPFIQNVSEYMSAADVYMTKPGGLTTTEAIAKKTPMILVNAVPGCETRNYRFLTEQGVAVGAKSWRNASAVLRRMLQSEKDIERQRAAMESFEGPRAADAICRYLLRELSR